MFCFLWIRDRSPFIFTPTFILKLRQYTLTLSPKTLHFEQFLIDGNGVPVRRYRPGVEPEELTNDVAALLKTGTLGPAKKKKSLNDF